MALETGLIKRQIRRVWGFLVSPVSLKNKMMGFNEGDNGSGRDRTQQIAKGPTGIEHTFITIDEIEDYVKSEISSFNSGNDIYVKVTTMDELITAAALTGDFTIYADEGSNAGISAPNASFAINCIGNKTLIGAGGIAFTYDHIGVNCSIDFNVELGGTFEIRDSIYMKEYGNDFAYIQNAGDGVLKISEIRSYLASAIPITLAHAPPLGAIDPEKVLLEHNNTVALIDGTDFTFNLWSGKYSDFLVTKDIQQTVCREHRISSQGAFTLESEVVEFVGSPTTSSPLNYRDYNYTFGGTVSTYAQDQHSAKSSSVTAQYRSDFKKRLIGADGNLQTALQLNGNAQGFITKTTDPWDQNIVVFQVGAMTLYTDNQDIGIVYNAYNNGSWRFSSTENAKLEIFNGGKRTIYKNSNTPVADSAITWIPAIEGGYKYVEYIGTPALGVISGLSIPILDSGPGTYHVTLKGEVDSALTGSEYRLQMAIKQGGFEFDNIVVHQYDSSSTLVVEERTFCTSFVCEVNTTSDFQFEVTVINNLSALAKLKSSAIRIA